MKKCTIALLMMGFIGIMNPLKAQSIDEQKAFKNHINTIVNKVEKAKSGDQKREVLEESLSDLIVAIDKVRERISLSETDKEGLADLKDRLQNRKDELKGINGYQKVPNNKLNQYAHFIQQNIEQADAVSISMTTLLLIIIILLLI